MARAAKKSGETAVFKDIIEGLCGFTVFIFHSEFQPDLSLSVTGCKNGKLRRMTVGKTRMFGFSRMRIRDAAETCSALSAYVFCFGLVYIALNIIHNHLDEYTAQVWWIDPEWPITSPLCSIHRNAAPAVILYIFA